MPRKPAASHPSTNRGKNFTPAAQLPLWPRSNAWYLERYHQIKISGKGRKLRRYQYTAIDDATRIQALKMYPKHTQEKVIRFVNPVIEKFPFCLHTIRTDNGHEFQANFHWRLKDLGINHCNIKPAKPRLNGKEERSHLTDKLEFYQLIDFKGDVDLARKLRDWEAFYNFLSPHAALNGITPYERLRGKQSGKN